MKQRYPEHFEDLVRIDHKLREPGWRKDYGMVFLHASRRPLEKVMANAESQQTFLPELFGDECHGVCNV